VRERARREQPVLRANANSWEIDVIATVRATRHQGASASEAIDTITHAALRQYRMVDEP
jgi:hypothetical protein